MKKKLYLIFSLVCLLLLLAACGEKSPTYHSVSFNSNGAEEFQSRAIAHNDLVIEPQVPTRIGYAFLGWYKGDAKWNFESDKVTESFTLTAKWKRITFAVKFDSNGGSTVEEQVVESGNFATKPSDPTKQNSRFVGWYNGNDEWFFNINRVTDYITLVAKWEDFPTYTVEFNSNGGSGVESQYVIEGNKVTEPTPPTRKNFKFLGWFDGDVIWNFNANTINSNKMLTAKWEEMPTLTVVFDSNGGSAVEPQYVVEGGKATKPMTPEKEQRSNFIGWYLGDTEWNFDTVVTENITLVAKWQNVYKVTFSTEGLSDDLPIPVNEGELVPKQKEPTKENFRFIGWYFGDEKWNFDTDIPTSDITLIAKWEPIPTYTVSFDSAGGSKIDSQYLLENAFVKDPGNPTKDGFRFDGWYMNGKLWNFNKDKLSAHITLTAKWVEVVTIQFYTNGGSFLNPVTIDKGTAVSMPQDPVKDGYVFRGWLIENTDTFWDFNTKATQSITLVANWRVACKVTFYEDDPDNNVTPTVIIVGEGEFIQAPKLYDSENYFVEGWFIAGTETQWNFEKMPVNSDVTLIAKWCFMLPFPKPNT